MDKKSILDKYKKNEEKLLVSKFLDKIEHVTKTNKIETTDFLNELEQNIIKKVSNLIQYDNLVFYGGNVKSDRKIVIIYPEKMKEIFDSDNFKYDTILSCFRIIIPKIDRANFNHSIYLGGIIKLGINRAKIGDILVYDEGADIIVKKETEKFLIGNIKTLNRFSNSEISLIKLDEMVNYKKEFQDIKIITSSLRLDNLVSELAKTSRNKACEILEQERVFVNYQNETKATKQIKEKDVITIRGKGKFILDEIIGNTSKGNVIMNIKKFI